jgi:hypothetical protein
MLSNDSSKFFQSILRKAWNEYRRLPSTSPLQLSLIELDEAKRLDAEQKRLESRVAKKQAAEEKRLKAEAKRQEAEAMTKRVAFNRAERAEKQAEKLSADKLEITNNLAERASFKCAEEKKRVAAAKEAADKLAAGTNCTEHDSSSKNKSK